MSLVEFIFRKAGKTSTLLRIDSTSQYLQGFGKSLQHIFPVHLQQTTCILLYYFVTICIICYTFVIHIICYGFSLLNCCQDIKTNNGFFKFISVKKFDYKYHQTAVIIHLEIIYLYCLGIVLFILSYFACKSTIFILGVGFFALVEEGRVEGVLINVELFLVGHEHWQVDSPKHTPHKNIHLGIPFPQTLLTLTIF